MNQSYALRKGRYVDFNTKNATITAKISDSTVIKKEPIMFDIFNIPVECIQIDTKTLLVSDTRNHTLYVSSIDKLDEDIFKRSHVVLTETELFVPLSEIKFSSPNRVELFRKLRRQL